MEAASKLEFLCELFCGQNPVGVDLATELVVQPAARTRRDRIRITVKVKGETADPGGEPTLLRGSQGVCSLRHEHKKSETRLITRLGIACHPRLSPGPARIVLQVSPRYGQVRSSALALLVDTWHTCKGMALTYLVQIVESR